MKTVVFQSYRTSGVAGWMNTCMASTKEWARSRGFDYRFFDDGFFELAPAWFRERCGGEICPVTDLARLVAARGFLAEGYERTIWVDADVLVFDPESFEVDVTDGFAFCLEIWGLPGEEGQPRFERRINNSVSVFTRGNAQLGFFIDACLRIAKSKERLNKLDVGTRFLSGLATLMPMPVVLEAGTLCPMLVNEIASGVARDMPQYAGLLPGPLAAANLCGSLVGQQVDGAEAAEAAFDKTVAALLESRGEVINRHITPPLKAP